MTSQRIAALFEEIVGWPYASPGTNDANGIDCSGAFVRAFAAEGQSIYHGSNRIARAHCSNVFALNGSADGLRVGCAVFKTRADDGALPACYQPGGEHYVAALPQDFYHIGLVTGVDPLRIVHATTPCAKVDASLGAWSHAGFLLGVDYADDAASIAPEALIAYVSAESGTTVNLRKSASRKAVVLARLPIGACVRVLREQGDWARVAADGHTGWVMRAFLASDASSPTATKAPAVLTERIALLEQRIQRLEAAIQKEDGYAEPI